MALCPVVQAQLAAGNVRPVQRAGTKLVDIDYDVTGTTAPLSVSLQISADGGSTWAVPATSLTGAIGNTVTAGSNRRITWDAGADWNQQVSAQTKFRLSVMEIIAPAITTQPLAVSINSGATATLTVATSGSESTYQWYIGNAGDTRSPVSGATSTSFTTPALAASTTYWVRASNRAGTADSSAVTVTAADVPTGFALIPSGSFTMGDALDGGGDAHTVTVSAFYMAKNLVSKADWDTVRTWAISNGYSDLATGAGKADNHPVQTVSWYQMVKYCNARSEMEGLTPVYYNNDAQTSVYKTGDVDVTNAQVKWVANGYRLPTEAEWEKAARGGLSGKRFPWGDTISQSQANYYGSTGYGFDLGPNGFSSTWSASGAPFTSPVGSFAANGYGLNDMAGNVWQWCWDRYGTYDTGSPTDPRGVPSGSSRVIRGGGWNYFADGCRVVFRGNNDIPSNAFNYIGFRVARSSVVPADFALIPAGSFTMGDALDGGGDAHTVTVSAFYMAKNLVTWAEWQTVKTWAVSNGYTDFAAGAGKADNHPVQMVSWWDGIKYCNARSQKEGLTPVYMVNSAVMKTGTTAPTVNWTANGYRLPTEAEWEKAARGGLSGRRFPWGDTISQSQANYYAKSGYAYDLSGAVDNFHPTYATGAYLYTSPVGSFAANGYGLNDMAGNVVQWCWDWYGTYDTGSPTDPRGASSGSYRVFRSGGWVNYANLCRVANRLYDYPSYTDFNIGFRVARSSAQ